MNSPPPNWKAGYTRPENNLGVRRSLGVEFLQAPGCHAPRRGLSYAAGKLSPRSNKHRMVATGRISAVFADALRLLLSGDVRR